MKSITKYVEMDGLSFRIGNKKLPKTTIIFNMGSATDCPSREKDLCMLEPHRCYAIQAEERFEKTKQFRQRQTEQWFNSDPWVFARAVEKLHNRYELKLFRFNESGDFWNQESVDNLSKIASYLNNKCGMVTYGYTARYDLDFTNVTFNVRISHPTIQLPGALGNTIVVEHPDAVPVGYYVCAGDCRVCSKCASPVKGNIAFRYHGNGAKRSKALREAWDWYFWKRQRRR